MIGALMENLIGGFLHPRASARRLLGGGHGYDAALLMVLLAFLVREIFFVITPGARLGTESVSLGRYALQLINALITFALFSAAICYVGRMFGGKGGFRQTALVLSWYLLITSAIVPLMLPAMLEIFEVARAAAQAPAQPAPLPGWAVTIVLAGSGVLFWLLASYIAELHGFASTLRVLVAVICLSLPLYMVASVLVSAI